MIVSTTFICLGILLVFSTVAMKFLVRKRKGKPIPGPTGLKCLAAFVQSARKNNLHHLATDWALEFGDIVCVSLWPQNVVYINDSKLIRRLFNAPDLKEVTNDRPPTFISNYVVYNNKNVAFTARTLQQQRRRKLFHSILKFYGDNVQKFEKIIMVSMKKLNEQIRRNETVELTKEISSATLRIVDILLAGENHEYTDKHLKVLEDFDACFNSFFIFDNECILQLFPFLRLIPGLALKEGYDALTKARDDLAELYIQEGREVYDPDVKRGMVDNLLKAQKKLIDEGDSTLMEDDIVKSLICESTIASYLTTYLTANTFFLLMILQPQIQDKLFTEITSVIGDDVPSLRHRNLMPYMEACILEVLRYASSAPFLLPHYSREDVLLDGYCIPKGSVLVPNVWYSHRREDQWEDPWSFIPERFLDKQGNLLQADHPVRQNLIPFGTGSRACPGEAFARSRLFLILTSLMQKFEFSALEDEKLPSVDPRHWPTAAVVGPGEFKCKVRLRN